MAMDRAVKNLHFLSIWSSTWGDGRAMRKLVAAACARDKEVALNPAMLTNDLLLAAARDALHARGNEHGRHA